MSDSPCDLRIDCLPCPAGNPLRNISAEAPDPADFFAVSFFAGNPPLNSPPDDYTAPYGFGFCFGLTLQAAQDCARHAAQNMTWDPWRRPGGGTVPQFGNAAQSCTAPCNDGELFTYTIPANTFFAHSQAEADAIAASYCFTRAVENRICPPLAVTTDASDIGDDSATLNGTINPNNTDELDITVGYFEYGLTTAYGSFTPLEIIGTGTTATAISAPLTGLTPGSTYHFRIVAVNALGTAIGADKTFDIASGCSNPNVPVPSSLFTPITEAPVATGVFQQVWTAPVNNVLSASVPVGKPGIYQLRYKKDGQGIHCNGEPASSCIYGIGLGHYLWKVNGIDRTLTDVYPSWANGSNPVGITVQAHAGFWSATAGYLIGVGGSILWICDDTPPPDYDPDPGAVYDDAYFTGILDNPVFPARYQKFCFERNLIAGDAITFSLFQEQYVTCSGATIPDQRANMIPLGNGPTWEFVRVGTLPTMPTNLRVVNFADASKELLCPAALGGAGINWTGNIARSTYSSINGVDALAYQITDGSTAFSTGDPAVVKLLKNFGAGVRVTWTSVAWICEIRDRNNLLIWSGQKTKGATPVGKYEITGGCTSLACLEWEEF